MMFECINKVYPSVSIDTVTGAICSFTDEYGGLPLKSCVSQISGYQEGSGTPSPSNVRPLHAFSSGSFVNDDGNNILDNSLLENSYSWKTLNFVGEPNTEYVMTSDLPNNDVIKMFILSGGESYPVNTHSPQTVISQSNGRITIQYRNFNTTDYDIANYNFYVKKGNSYTFTFGQSIYQGSIDWKKGVVVGTHSIVDLGSLTWLYNTQYVNPIFYTNLVDAKLLSTYEKGDTLAEIFETYSVRDMNKAGVDYAVAISEPHFFSAYNLYVVDSDYTDPTAFKTAMNGVMLAYELATPIEIPLGGVNLLTQEGQNNIYCDTGDTTIEYIKIV